MVDRRPLIEAALLTKEEAAEASGISRSRLTTAISRGELRSTKSRNGRRIVGADLRRFLGMADKPPTCAHELPE
jgi:excisionase family DNA binding protein